MGLRRSGVTKDYEEMPGTNVPTGLEAVETNRDHTLSQEFELSSVSVVPDGILFDNRSHSFTLIFTFNHRHLHSHTSRKCIRFWVVSSEIISVRWFVLDGRFNGNDYFKCTRSRITL